MTINKTYKKICIVCGHEFEGHKNRLQCKDCDTNKSPFNYRNSVGVNKWNNKKERCMSEFLKYVLKGTWLEKNNFVLYRKGGRIMCEFISFFHLPDTGEIKVWDLESHGNTEKKLELDMKKWREGHYTPKGRI